MSTALSQLQLRATTDTANSAAFTACVALAQAADTAAGLMDGATTAAAFNAAAASYEAARLKLRDGLLGLSLSASSAWTAQGLGLLPVGSFLRQSDAAASSLFEQIMGLASEMEDGRADFHCTVEAHLIVYPERSPLDAILLGSGRLAQADDFDTMCGDQLGEALVAHLGVNGCWAPGNAASISDLLAQVSTGGASSPAAAADEATVRQCLSKYGSEWAQLRDALLAGADTTGTALRTALPQLAWPAADDAQAVKDFLVDLFRRILTFREQLAQAFLAAAATQAAPDALARYGSRFRWPGWQARRSYCLTAGHLVSLRGTGSEAVLAAFNTLFRQWTLGTVDATGAALASPAAVVATSEPAFVLGISVLADDCRQGQRPRFLADDDVFPAFWPQGTALRSQAALARDTQALLALRRRMTDAEWATFTAACTDSKVTTLLQSVDPLWTTLQSDLTAAGANLAPTPAGNLQIRTENELYQTSLNKRDAAVANGAKPLDDPAREAISEASAAAASRAPGSAPPPGTGREILAAVQADKAGQVDPAGFLCCFLYQAAGLYNAVTQLDQSQPLPGTTDAAAALKVSREMLRLAQAVLSLHYQVAGQVVDSAVQSLQLAQGFIPQDPASADDDDGPFAAVVFGDMAAPDLSIVDSVLLIEGLCLDWRAKTERLIEINLQAPAFTTNGTWDADAQRCLADTPWAAAAGATSPIASLRGCLSNLVAAAHARLRNGQSASAISQFLKRLLVLATSAAQAATETAQAAAAPTAAPATP